MSGAQANINYHGDLASGAVTDLQGETNLAGPRVLASSPSGNATAPIGQLTFTFSEAISGDTFNYNPFGGIIIGASGVQNAGGGTVGGTGGGSSGGNGLVGIQSFTLTSPDGLTVTDLTSTITSISSDSTNTHYTVSFQNTAKLGTYRMVIGPNIADKLGDPMDQDGDGIPGESTDTYTATFTITQAPDLVVTTASADTASVVTGGTVNVSYTVANHGNAGTGAGSWQDVVYLSPTPTYDPSTAYSLGSYFPPTGSLAPQPATGDDSTNSYSFSNQTLTIPSYAPTGNEYLLFYTDPYQELQESNEDNNVAAVPIDVTPPNIDLVVTGETGLTPNQSVTLGTPLSVTYTVANHGSSPTTAGYWYDSVYLSSTAPDATVPFSPGNATLLQTTYGGQAVDYHYGTLQGQPSTGDDSTNSFTVDHTQYYNQLQLPSGITPGQYYVVFVTDYGPYWYEQNQQQETDKTNNFLAVPINLTAPNVDLVVTGETGLTSNQDVSIGSPLSVTYTVANHGSSPTTAGYWYDSVYLSSTAPAANVPFNPGNATLLQTTYNGQAVDTHYGTMQGQPANGDDYTNSYTVDHTLWYNQLQLPSGITPGQYYVVFVTNYGPYSSEQNQQQETDKTNNFLAVPINVQGADLAVTPGSVSVTPDAGSVDSTHFTVSYTVQNQGDETATGSGYWIDALFVSDKAAFDPSDPNQQLVTTWQINSPNVPLAPQAGYSPTEDVTLPANIQGGQRDFLVYTNYYSGYLTESNLANNTGATATPIAIDAPDLEVTSASGPASGTAAVDGTVNLTWTVHNQGDVPATAQNWYDSIYYSTSPTFGSTAGYLTSFYEAQAPLQANGVTDAQGDTDTYTDSENISLSHYNFIPGQQYYFYVKVNDSAYSGQPQQGETDYSNNVSAAIPIMVTAPDLAILSPVTAPSTAISGGQINVSWTVTNQTSSPAPASWDDAIYLLPSPTFNPNQISYQNYLGYYYRNPQQNPLDGTSANSQYTGNLTVTIPSSLGTGQFYLYVVTNAHNLVPYFYTYQGETDNQNNSTDSNDISAPVPITVGAPDLTVAAPTASDPTSAVSTTTASIGQTVNVSYTVTNQGTMDAPGPWTDLFYFSPDTNPRDGTYAGSLPVGTNAPLPVGSNYTITGQPITVPNVAPSTTRYLLIVTNGDVAQSETDYTNDVLAVPFTVTAADVQAQNVTTDPTTLKSGDTFTIHWSDKNTADAATGGATQTGWWDQVVVTNTDTGETLVNQPVYYDPSAQGNGNLGAGIRATGSFR